MTKHSGRLWCTTYIYLLDSVIREKKCPHHDLLLNGMYLKRIKIALVCPIIANSKYKQFVKTEDYRLLSVFH